MLEAKLLNLCFSFTPVSCHSETVSDSAHQAPCEARHGWKKDEAFIFGRTVPVGLSPQPACSSHKQKSGPPALLTEIHRGAATQKQTPEVSVSHAVLPPGVQSQRKLVARGAISSHVIGT